MVIDAILIINNFSFQK